MSAVYLRMVLAFRGHGNKVTGRHCEFLERVWGFFLGLRSASESDGRGFSRVFDLPWVGDWYDGCGEFATVWEVDNVEDEQTLFGYVVKLDKLGIPTLLQEVLRSDQLQKFWTSLRVIIRPLHVGTSLDGCCFGQQLALMQDDLVDLVISNMLKTIKLYCSSCGVGKQVIAVLASSVCSDFGLDGIFCCRVVFQGVSLTGEELRTWRNSLVSFLEGSCSPGGCLSLCRLFEPVCGRVSSCAATEGDLTWDRLVSQPELRQPLAWCDCVNQLVPGGSVLRPYALMVYGSEDTHDIHSVPVSSVRDADWCVLGSVLSFESSSSCARRAEHVLEALKRDTPLP